MWLIIPIPRFANTCLILFAVDDFWNECWVIPFASFLVWILWVIEVGGKVKQHSRIIADCFKPMPIVPRYTYHLQI